MKTMLGLPALQTPTSLFVNLVNILNFLLQAVTASILPKGNKNWTVYIKDMKFCFRKKIIKLKNEDIL